MATKPARSRQNGRAIWLYKRPFRHRILRFLLLQRRRLRLQWPRSLLAVDMPRSWTQRPRSARLIHLFCAPQHRSSSGPVRCRHPANLTHTPKRANQRCCKCRAVTVARAGPPCTPMTVTASAFPAWGNPMQMPHSLALIVLTARTSVSPLCARGSISFQRATLPLAPSRFLPPRDLWGKNSGAEDLSARLRASSRRLRSRVPRSRHTERFLPSFFPNLTSVPLQARAIWSRSGEVTMSWLMTACHWQLQMLRSCWAR